MRTSRVRHTIDFLQACQRARAEGHPVSFTTDPAWLVEVAINRRAGWPDDPSHSRGSCRPVNGKYPKKAEGDTFNHLRLLAARSTRRGWSCACPNWASGGSCCWPRFPNASPIGSVSV